ncbi:hypothetical protein IEQ34_009236 [Dendrobium chrysotoxum]|uniref:Uncharacterized protein n=1 Tax=Dendrobium chrysotoxum TaxID=161865 RepID=A0AAV7GZV7_DENCH|nr:hypothetical protein IEQ34_009236 [Dendrobium chrysotoxum]
MSDSREGEEEEGLTREDDELLKRCSRNLHHADEEKYSDDQIDRELQHQQPWASLDQRKGKNKKKDRKVNSSSNRRKMQAKAKKFLFSSLSRFDKDLDDTKNKTTAATTRRSAPPFPYNGEDFGGSSSRYVCFLRPLIPPSSTSPVHSGTAATVKTPGAGYQNQVTGWVRIEHDTDLLLIYTNPTRFRR